MIRSRDSPGSTGGSRVDHLSASMRLVIDSKVVMGGVVVAIVTALLAYLFGLRRDRAPVAKRNWQSSARQS